MKVVEKIKKAIRIVSHPLWGEIWCLHRVTPIRSEFLGNRELQITPAYFESRIKSCIRDGYSFVSLDSFLSDQGIIKRCFRRRWCVITFDDGFRDVYDYAFPILKKYGIPFTIYLTTGMPDGTACLWWEQLEQCVCDSKEFDGAMIELGKSKLRRDAFLSNYADNNVDIQLTKRLSLTWNQIQEMLDSGLCTIGSHTVSHAELPFISVDEVRKELNASKKRIEEMLHINVKHFSYPHSMMNDRVAQMVKECGYRSATMGYGGAVHYGDNPYKLNRVYITEN